MSAWIRRGWWAGGLCFMFWGCAGDDAPSGGDPSGDDGLGMSTGSDGGDSSVRLPTPDMGFDYQIGGAYPPPEGVTAVSRDRADPPAAGLYNLCYVNGFQIQEVEEAWWLDQYPELILRDDDGAPLIDPDWDEMLLDTSTTANREAIATIVGEWIAGCAAAGFDAVEIDNLDSDTRSEGRISADDNVAMMAAFSATAHEYGLALGQKNAFEMLPRIAELGTDFAVTEECFPNDECAGYADAYDDRVFVIEYRREDFEGACAAFSGLSIVLRDLDVLPASEVGYVFDRC